MASPRLLLCSSLAVLLLLLVLNPAVSSAASPLRTSEKLGGGGGRVGGRTEIKDVGTNKEVQELGRFAVEEYNRRSGGGSAAGGGSNGPLLSFTRVVAAQRQVVAGVKYFLTVAAKGGHGEVRTFDAVVVVRAWLKSKELVSFTPSTN